MIGEMIAADIGLVHHLSGVGLLAEERRPRATTTTLWLLRCKYHFHLS